MQLFLRIIVDAAVMKKGALDVQSLSLLILRLCLATVIFAHGSQKVLGLFGGHGLTQTFHVFTTGMGYPAILVALAFTSEFLGSLGVAFGFLTRLSAFGIFCTMAVAMSTGLQNGFFMNWGGKQTGEGIEYFIPVMGIAVVLMIAGAGQWSLDRFLPWTKAKKSAGQSA